MIVPRYVPLRDAMIFHRRLEHHAVGQLIDHAALDLLPRRLARGILPAAVPVQRGAPPRELRVGDQHVRAPLVEVDAYAVAGLEQSEPAARRRLRRSIDDRWRGRGSGL